MFFWFWDWRSTQSLIIYVPTMYPLVYLAEVFCLNPVHKYISLYWWILNIILSICTTKHNLNFDTFYLIKRLYWPPPNFNTVRKLRFSAFQRYRGLGVADRVFLTKYASAQYGWGCDFTEFDGAMKTRPFFVIMKSSKNSYKHFYVNRKLPEQLSSVTSCDMFCIFLWRDVNSRT